MSVQFCFRNRNYGAVVLRRELQKCSYKTGSVSHILVQSIID